MAAIAGSVIGLDAAGGVNAVLTTLAAAAVLYLLIRVSVRLYVLLCEPLDYCAEAAHLEEKAAVKRGLVTRNVPGGEAPATPDSQRRAPYPNGWFFVDLSATFRRGHVRHLSMLGLELAVFRDEKGEVHALDAYCPHLGANMAIGGRIVGDCLECPFHGWQFRGSDGKCQLVPGAKRVPEAAATHSWRVLERNGAVFLWHHAKDREPDWLPPEVDDIDGAGIDQMCGRTEHVVFAHIQDIPENGADTAHFDVVHKASSMLGSDMRQLDTRWVHIGWHKWKLLTPWKPMDHPDGHIAKTALNQDIVIGSWNVPLSHVDVNVMQIGPGIVNMILHNPVLGCYLLLCQYVVPEEPLKQRVTHVMYSQRGFFNRLYGKFILSQERYMVERDIQIWNNKCFRPQPVFAASAGDECLLRFRRWFSQFYSPLSDMSGRYATAGGRRNLEW